MKQEITNISFIFVFWMHYDNWLEDLWRTESPDSTEFTGYDRFCGKRTRIDGVYADIKIANNTNIRHRTSFTDHYNARTIDRFPSKTKIGKALCHFNNSFLSKNHFSSTSKNLLPILKRKKKKFFTKWLVGIHQMSN